MNDLDMTGFEVLDTDVSSKFNAMWYKFDEGSDVHGTLRVEYHNRKKGAATAVYDYAVDKAVIVNLINSSREAGSESFGKLFHSYVVAHPEVYPYTCVRHAE